MSADERTDQLIALVATGDRRAFRMLMEEQGAHLAGLCHRLSADKREAAMLYERAWLSIWQAAPDYAAGTLDAGDWLILLVRGVAVSAKRAARARLVPDDLAHLADLPPVLPSQGALASCLALLPAEDAEAVVRAIEDGESEAELGCRFGVPQKMMRDWLDRTFDAVDRCMGGTGGAAAARQVLGLATVQEARALAEAQTTDSLLAAAHARWAHGVASTLAAPPQPPPPEARARIEQRLFAEQGGSLLRRIGVIPSLIAALIGALFLLFITDMGGEAPGGPPLAQDAARD